MEVGIPFLSLRNLIFIYIHSGGAECPSSPSDKENFTLQKNEQKQVIFYISFGNIGSLTAYSFLNYVYIHFYQTEKAKDQIMNC